MRIIMAILFFSVALTGCAHTRAITPGQPIVQRVVDAPGMSMDEVFERSKMWFAWTFRQPVSGLAQDNWTRNVIRYEDRAGGVLIANASILYPYSNFSTDTHKEGWEVRFTIQEDMKEGKARITISDPVMYVPPHICGYAYPTHTSVYQKELTSREFEKVRPILLSLPDSLDAYLKGNIMGAKW